MPFSAPKLKVVVTKDKVLKEALVAVSELLVAVVVVFSPLSSSATSARVVLMLLLVGWGVPDDADGVVPDADGVVPPGNKVVSATGLLLVSVVVET